MGGLGITRTSDIAPAA
jgi:hypothetical protein